MDCAYANTSELSIKRYRYEGRKTAQGVVDLVDTGLDAAEFQVFARADLFLHHERVLHGLLVVGLGRRRIKQLALEEEFSMKVVRLYVNLSAKFYEVSYRDLLFCVAYKEDFSRVGGWFVVDLRILKSMEASFALLFHVVVLTLKIVGVSIVDLTKMRKN